MRTLGEALKMNRTLATLMLGARNINNKKTHESDVMSKNKTENEMDAEGARTLSEALKVNTTLKTLSLCGGQHKWVSCKQRHSTNSINGSSRKRVW